MVDLKATKKAAINNKTLKGIPSDLSKVKIGANENEVVFQSKGYEVTFKGEFKNLKQIIPGRQEALPTDGTIDKIIVKKDSKKLYTIKNVDVEISDLYDKIIQGASAKDIAEYVFDGDDSLCGSNKNDKLYGFAGEDFIKSRKGKDKSWGGDDDDIFHFNEFGKKNFDKMKDFADGGAAGGEKDSIELGKKFSKKLGSELTADEFVVGNKATANKAQMIYDDGKLWYDKDGTGNSEAKLVAKFAASVVLDEGHFMMA